MNVLSSQDVVYFFPSNLKRLNNAEQPSKKNLHRHCVNIAVAVSHDRSHLLNLVSGNDLGVTFHYCKKFNFSSIYLQKTDIDEMCPVPEEHFLKAVVSWTLTRVDVNYW